MRNDYYLEGKVGDDVKFGKTVDGKEYCTMTVIWETSNQRGERDETERTHAQTYIRIMVFDKRQVEYLKKVKVRSGNMVIIVGRINSHKTEIKGNAIIQNNVVVRSIRVVKFTADEQD